MVAVVRGERSPAGPRSKTASAARSGAAVRRPAPARPKAKARAEQHESAGLGPKLALIVGALVIVGGAAAGVVVSHREHARAAASPAGPDTHSPPLARLVAPLGFRLARVEVQGGSAMAKGDLLEAANLTRNTPILGVNLDQLRDRVEKTGWVKDAKVVRLLPDTIIIAVTPRTAAAIWQHLGVSKVVDVDGKLIDQADPARFPDLPLVVGEGAAEEAHNILPLLHQHGALTAKVDALVRVDGRRWDLRLKDGALIQLPAIGEDSALIQLDQLDQKQRLLSLGFEKVDLRDPDAITVRPKPAAPGGAAVGPVGPSKG